VTSHSDDAHLPRVGAFAEHDRAADRVAAGKEMSRKRGTHDGHELTAGPVARVEFPPALEPNPRRGEISGRDRGEPGREILVMRRLEPGDANQITHRVS